MPDGAAFTSAVLTRPAAMQIVRFPWCGAYFCTPAVTRGGPGPKAAAVTTGASSNDPWAIQRQKARRIVSTVVTWPGHRYLGISQKLVARFAKVARGVFRGIPCCDAYFCLPAVTWLALAADNAEAFQF